jgi:hypothetical protein
VNLTKMHDLHAGEQNSDGSYVILHEVMTLCEPCSFEKGWGCTRYPDDVADDKCGLCGISA